PSRNPCVFRQSACKSSATKTRIRSRTEWLTQRTIWDTTPNRDTTNAAMAILRSKHPRETAGNRTMLTDAEVGVLRRRVEVANNRPTRERMEWATYADGPLAGLRTRLPRDDFNNPNLTTEWCYLKDSGLVAVRYEQSETLGRLKFRGYVRPGQKESA